MSVGITMLKNAYRAQRLDRCDCISCKPETTEALRRENERLREALQGIAEVDLTGCDLTAAGYIAHALIGRAKAALRREEAKP